VSIGNVTRHALQWILAPAINFQLLRHGKRLEDLADDVLRCDVFRFRLMTDGHTMSQDIQSDQFDVMRSPIVVAVEKLGDAC